MGKKYSQSPYGRSRLLAAKNQWIVIRGSENPWIVIRDSGIGESVKRIEALRLYRKFGIANTCSQLG